MLDAGSKILILIVIVIVIFQFLIPEIEMADRNVRSPLFFPLCASVASVVYFPCLFIPHS